MKGAEAVQAWTGSQRLDGGDSRIASRYCGAGILPALLLISAFCLLGPGLAPALQTPGFGIYGGSLMLTCPNTTSHFITWKNPATGRWYFCTSGNTGGNTSNTGHVFFANAIGNLLAETGVTDCNGRSNTQIYVTKYANCGVAGKPACVGGQDPGTYYNWGWHTEKLMQSWGFNTVGQDAGAYVAATTKCNWGPTLGSNGYCNWPPVGGSQNPNPIKFPYITEPKPEEYAMLGDDAAAIAQGEPVKDFMNGLNYNWNGYRGDGLTDSFDPKLSTYWVEWLQSAKGAYITSNDPYLLGVVTDDTDYCWGCGPGPDFYTSVSPNTSIAFSAILTSPIQTAVKLMTFSNGGPFVYGHTILDAKADATNPSHGTCQLGSHPCSLHDYLYDEYSGSISALNTAWSGGGSPWCTGGNCPNYSSFESSCSMVGTVGDATCPHGTNVGAETIGTGDGSTQGFKYTVSHHPLSPLSLLIAVGGTAEIGSTAWFDYSGGANGIGGSGMNYGELVTNKYIGATASGNGTTATITLPTGGSYPPFPPSITVGSTVVVSNCSPGGYNGTQTVTAADSSARTFSYNNATSAAGTGCWATPQILTPIITGATASESGTTVTVTTSALPAGFASGWVFGMTGCSVTGYNGGFAVTGVVGNTFTYTDSNTGLGNASNCKIQPNAVNYSTGVVNLSFATAPASSTTIQANYVYSGWMSGGTGLMDESGSGQTTWSLQTIGSNAYCLEPANPSYPTYFACQPGNPNSLAAPNACNGVSPCQPAIDLDAWIGHFAAEKFMVMKQGLTTAGAAVPYLGTDTVGAYNVTAFSQFLKGTGPWVDAGFFDALHTNEPGGANNGLTALAAEYQYVTQYFGAHPFIQYDLIGATQDSSYSCKNVTNDLPTQSARGQVIYNTMNYLESTPSYNGDYPLVGYSFWNWQDWQGFNQGLVTIDDNPYDGIAAEQAAGVDAFGVPTGGELGNYGCFICWLKPANNLWLQTLTGRKGAISGPVVIRGPVQ